MTTTIAVANQKGGVGKTTTTVNLAHRLAARNLRVLVVDSDPQANATSILNAPVDDETRTLNDALAAVATGQAGPGAAAAAVTPAGPAWDSIDLVPSERALAAREADTSPGREFLLRATLDGVATGHGYDVVLIDCPPSLGALTLGALTAADQVLILTEPRASSTDGVAQLMDTITTVTRYYNPHLTTARVLINRWRSDRLDRAVWRDVLHDTWGDLVIDHHLPEREVVATAATNHVPVPHKEAHDYVNALDAVARELVGTVTAA